MEEQSTDQIPVVPDEVIPPVYEVGVVPAGADMTETRLDYLPPTPAEVVSKMSYRAPQEIQELAKYSDPNYPWMVAGPPPGVPARARSHRRRVMKERAIVLWLVAVFVAFLAGMAYALIFVA